MSTTQPDSSALTSLDSSEQNQSFDESYRLNQFNASPHGHGMFEYDEAWPTVSAGYLQGTWGMPHISFGVNYHRFDFFPMSHFGFRGGTFFGFPKNPVKIAPFATFEYRYVIFVGRAGVMFPFQNRVSYISPYTEIGFSLLSFLDITWMYAFSEAGTHNRTKGSYINVQLSIPMIFLIK